MKTSAEIFSLDVMRSREPAQTAKFGLSPAPLDGGGGSGNDGGMPDIPNRHELDAKLAEIAMRMDARAAQIDARMDRALDRLDRMQEGFGELKQEMREVRVDLKSMRWWIAGAALTTILGVGALNYQLIQGMATAFERGATAGGYTAQIGEELKRISSRLDAIEQRQLSGDAKAGASASGAPR